MCLQDFSIGFVLVAVVCALTFGQCGDTTHGENFFDQMRNSHVRAPPAWSYAWQMRYMLQTLQEACLSYTQKQSKGQ